MQKGDWFKGFSRCVREVGLNVRGTPTVLFVVGVTIDIDIGIDFF